MSVARNAHNGRRRRAIEGEFGHLPCRDVIILDLNLPDGDGLQLLSEWRRCGFNESVLILSAHDAVEDRIKELNLGADDYLPKPFSFDELLAHVRSLLLRQSAVKQTVITHRCVRLDLLGHTVKLRDQTVDLTSREFALLEIFMQNAGRTLTRSYISEQIWPGLTDTNLLDVCMSRLRTKLEPELGEPLSRRCEGSASSWHEVDRCAHHILVCAYSNT